MSKDTANQNTETPAAAKTPTELSDDHLDKVQGGESRSAKSSNGTARNRNQLWGDWF